jgi:hypothetical protein
MPSPVIVFGDATAAVVGLLRVALAPVAVHAKVPATRPDEFVTAYRTGGAARNLVVDDATMIIEGWSYQDERAQDLAQQARSAVHAAVGDRVGPQLLLVCDTGELAGPALLPDPLSSQTRYTLTLQVSFRASNA